MSMNDDEGDDNVLAGVALIVISILALWYRLDELEILPANLHFADGSVPISLESLTLGVQGEAFELEPEGLYFYIRKELGADDQLGDERIRYEGIPASATATYFGVINDSHGVGKQFGVKSGILSGFIGGLI